ELFLAYSEMLSDNFSKNSLFSVHIFFLNSQFENCSTISSSLIFFNQKAKSTSVIFKPLFIHSWHSLWPKRFSLHFFLSSEVKDGSILLFQSLTYILLPFSK